MHTDIQAVYCDRRWQAGLNSGATSLFDVRCWTFDVGCSSFNMFFLSSLKIAFRAIRVQRMRSALTMLGIIIGVGTVIIIINAGSGAKSQIAKQIAGIGSNLLMVFPGSTSSGGVRMGAGTKPTLTISDAEAMKEACPSVKLVAPTWGGTAHLVFGNENWSTVVTGTIPDMFQIRNWPLAFGFLFNQRDINTAAKVCILGQTVVENLFGDIDPIGQVIRINKIPFTIIGVLDKKGSSTRGRDQDDRIYVPFSTAQKRLFSTHIPGLVRTIMVQAKSLELMFEAEKEINALLMQRHHIQSGQEKDFTVMNLTEIMNIAQKTANIMSVLLLTIAMISLVVGGIGIMNIMLVSVTERTREIGIRMAVGGRSKDILMQFLIEAIILSLFGGLLGMVLGITACKVIAAVIKWPIPISWEALLLAFVFTGAIGVFFGFYPANKASKLNPIDALRYE